ncbi:MAG: hypothetical protein K2X03_23640 [Bryobacteraceae bacterium]|nr:hypothetical protein [Bryobacteraceae bacterium]
MHGHTLHSQESLGFIPQICSPLPLVGHLIERQASRYRELNSGAQLDFNQAWWTPPLAPALAYELERRAIEQSLDRAALVSLTDHDTIAGPMQLRVLQPYKRVPVSVEWTVPFGGTFFHLGIHQMPAAVASEWMRAMEAFTQKPGAEGELSDLLAWFHASPQTLIVFNHPLWDEKGVGLERHWFALGRLLGECGRFFHALELNGLRPWAENRRVADLARGLGYPVISGGDRHGREPNACLNLTNATSFDQFVAEVRDGVSEVLFMPQYNHGHTYRILGNIADVLSEDPGHALGWRRWSDRVFYRKPDGVVKSLRELWGEREPWVIRAFTRGVGLMRHKRVERMVRRVWGAAQAV